MQTRAAPVQGLFRHAVLAIAVCECEAITGDMISNRQSLQAGLDRARAKWTNQSRPALR